MDKPIPNIFKAFCDNNRIDILRKLTTGEKNAHELLEGTRLAQPTLSYHMKILCDSGLVVCTKIGTSMYYSIDKDGVQYAQNIFKNLTTESIK